MYGYVTNPTEMVDPLGLKPTFSKVWVIEQGVCYVGTTTRDAMEEQVGEIDDDWRAENERTRQRREDACAIQRERLGGLGSLSDEEISQTFNSCMNDAAREANDRSLEITEEIRGINEANKPTTRVMQTLFAHCDFPPVPPWNGRR